MRALATGAVATALLASIQWGCSRPSTPEISRDDYRSLCRLLATPLSHQQRNIENSVEAILAHMAEKERALGQLAKSSPPIGPLAEQCEAVLSEMIGAASRLASTPQPNELVGLMRLGALFDEEEPTPLVRELLHADEESRRQLSAAALELRSLADRYHAVRLGLRQIAPSISGPEAARLPVQVEFLESGKTPGQQTDEIKLTNVSGRSLHDCLISVRLLGSGGESRTNLHFVNEWEPDLTLTTEYSGGGDVAGITLGRETVRNVRHIAVDVWARELSHRSH